MEKTSDVQIQVVAPHDGLSVRLAPRAQQKERLTEEYKQEHQEHDRYADWLCLCTSRGWSLCFNSSSNDHTNTHSNATDYQEELTPKSIDDPNAVKRKDNAKCGVEGVNESNLVGTGKHLLVDFRRVCVQ